MSNSFVDKNNERVQNVGDERKIRNVKTKTTKQFVEDQKEAVLALKTPAEIKSFKLESELAPA
jgi:hypothetical protein